MDTTQKPGTGKIEIKGQAVDLVYWLLWALDIWFKAGGAYKDEIRPAYYRAMGQIVGLLDREFTTDDLANIFAEYYSAEMSIDMDVNLTPTVGFSPTEECQFFIYWEGYWTEGRYFELVYCPTADYPLSVEWDTATGKESTFLSLPSKAINYHERSYHEENARCSRIEIGG